MSCIIRSILITIISCFLITDVALAMESSINEQRASVQKIVDDWCKQNNFDTSKVKVVSFLDRDENGKQLFLHPDSWGFSNSGIIYIPYDKILTVNKARIEATLAHESGHATLWNEAQVKSNSVFSEMYAMYLGDGGLEVAEDRKKAKTNFEKILKAYYGNSKTSYTQKEVKECALWCAKNLDSSPEWVDDLTKNSIRGNITASNKITSELIKKIRKREVTETLPPDTPSQSIQSSSENGSAGLNNSGYGGAGNTGRVSGRAFIDGKTGSQNGNWNKLNK